MARHFLILIDFDNLSIKQSINNQNGILFSESNFLLLNSIPALSFDDYEGIIITNNNIQILENTVLIYRGDYENNVILESYLKGTLNELKRTYYCIILDIDRKKLITFGSFFFYRERYKNQYFIFSDFELFYKLSEFTVDEHSAREFIKSGKMDILPCENKIIIFDLLKKRYHLEQLEPSKRNLTSLKNKSIELPKKFYYYIDLDELMFIYQNKLPIKITTLYQLETLLNKEMEIDFDSIVKGKINVRSLIVSNFENFYNAYQFFKLKNWLFDFIFRPIIIYRAFVLHSIITNFRL